MPDCMWVDTLDPTSEKRNMASGVAVSDGVIKVFNDMKVCKTSMPEEVKKSKKVVLFCLREDKKNIILEEGQEILETKESKMEDLVFIFSAPESALLKRKMINANSKDAIKKKLRGIKNKLQANCYEEVKDCCTLAEKLSGSAVISLEGKLL
ncbi:hypothetical protein U0070_000857 [Myodes glareolus]|uniref:ADF-H domain-containing protein n=1 Tax=Myodes glareolus TaxID=447135 RepID=A0AAW0HBC1_MYOGA